MATFALVGGSVAAMAQTDVTSTYLTNADFSSTEGWTEVVSGQFRDFGNGLIGEYTVRFSPATVDETHLATEYCFGLECRWNTNYASYTQTTSELPVGMYTLTYDVENVNGGTTSATYENRFFVEIGDNKIEDSSKEWMSGKSAWTTHTISFAITEASTATISLGYGTGSNNFGADNTPALYVSHLKLTYQSLIDGVKAELKAEIEKAQALSVADSEKPALEAAISEAESVLNSATAEQDLIDATAKLQRVEFLADNGLTSASSSSPSKNLLVNGSFDTANQGWTLTNMGYQANKERPTRYVEKWNQSALTVSGSAVQTVKNMPKGTYILTGAVNAQLQADQTLEITNAALSVNDQSVATSGVWKDYEIIYNLAADGDITVKFEFGTETGANWFCVDEFSLVYAGEEFDETVYRDAKLKSDWAAAQQAAQEALNNDIYTNVTGDERTALNNLVNAGEPAAGGYQTAIDELKAATTAFTEAKASYDALAAANDAIKSAELPYADSSLRPSTATASTAADAQAEAAAIYQALRAYYESNAKAYTVTDAVDVSNLIVNGVDPTNNDGWTWEGKKNNPASNEPWTDASGNSTHKYFDGGDWGAKSWTTKMSQTLSLPAGKYLLTAKGRAAINTTLTLAVGENSKPLPNVGSTGNVFDRGWGDASVEFTTDGSGATITVTASSETVHEWFSVSDFRLVRLELHETYADADDYAALNAAIEEAEKKTLGFEDGEYAPYNNVDALKALAAAKALNQESENGQENVQALTTALTEATWTANSGEVDAIYDGQFSNTEANSTSGEITLPGWTKVQGIRLLVKDEATDPGLAYTDGKAAVFSWGGTTLTYGEQAGYTLPLDPDGLYELTLKVSGWRDGDQPNYVSVELDGQKQEAAPVTLPINTSEGNPFETLTFYLKPTEENSILKIYGNHHFTIADLSMVKATPISVTVGSDGYATYVPEAPMDFSASAIKAYTAKVADGKVVLTKIEKVAAGTPVVLYCKGGKTEEIPFAATTDTPAESDLVAGNGATVTTTEGTYTNYILNVGTQGIGFYQANDQTVDKGRAYLHVAGSSEARLAVVFGDATGISSVKAAADGEAVYNLSGQRVKNAQKGIFIIGGKKVVVK